MRPGVTNWMQQYLPPRKFFCNGVLTFPASKGTVPLSLFTGLWLPLTKWVWQKWKGNSASALYSEIPALAALSYYVRKLHRGSHDARKLTPPIRPAVPVFLLRHTTESSGHPRLRQWCYPHPSHLPRRGPRHHGADSSRSPLCALLGFLTHRIHKLNKIVVLLLL